MSDSGKDKKIIIILSITCGFLLLFLLISGALNYKQNNEKTSCSSNLQAANSGLQNAQLAKSNLQNLQSSLQSYQDAQKKVLDSQKAKLRQMERLGNKDSNLTKEQIDCMLDKQFEKYTPFDILYNTFGLLIAFSQENQSDISNNPELKELFVSLMQKSQEIKKDRCQAAKSCNFPDSSHVMQGCTLYNI
jgi:hypothetical protein